MLPEYDFSKATRGKFAKKYSSGSNVVLLAPDVQKNFPDAEAVNETLRAIAKIANRNHKKISA